MQHVADTHGSEIDATTGVRRAPRLILIGLMLLLAVAGVGFYSVDRVGLQPPTVMLLFLAGAAVAAGTAALVSATRRFHGRYTMDCPSAGVQRSHTLPTPRIGGVAIIAGFLTIALADHLFSFDLPAELHAEFTGLLSCLLLAAIPAALSGLIEDVTKKVSVGVRLAATICSGLVAAVCAGAVIPHFNVWGLDALMALPMFAAVATAFCAGGVANAVNIIDGFNGLASGALVIMAAGFALLGVSVNDPVVVLLALSVAAVSAGFMVINYPAGKVFLGDGGAYLLGFMLAELAIVTAARHPELNAFSVLTLIAYPVLEVVVSVVRRKFNKASPGAPDRGHMHQQIQQSIRHSLFRVAGDEAFGSAQGSGPAINPQVSPIVWVLVLLMVAIGLLLPATSAAAMLGFAFCGALYVGVYRMVLTFNRQATAQRGVVLTPSLDIRLEPGQGVVRQVVAAGASGASGATGMADATPANQDSGRQISNAPRS